MSTTQGVYIVCIQYIVNRAVHGGLFYSHRLFTVYADSYIMRYQLELRKFLRAQKALSYRTSTSGCAKLCIALMYDGRRERLAP